MDIYRAVKWRDEYPTLLSMLKRVIFFSLYHLENKKIVYFCPYTEEWYIKEIKLLTRNFVSSAAEK